MAIAVGLLPVRVVDEVTAAGEWLEYFPATAPTGFLRREPTGFVFRWHVSRV
jgi:hypothetical protein